MYPQKIVNIGRDKTCKVIFLKGEPRVGAKNKTCAGVYCDGIAKISGKLGDDTDIIVFHELLHAVLDDLKLPIKKEHQIIDRLCDFIIVNDFELRQICCPSR